MPANPYGDPGLLLDRYRCEKRSLLLTMKELITLQLQTLFVSNAILGSHVSYIGQILMNLALRWDVATIWEAEAQVKFLRR